MRSLTKMYQIQHKNLLEDTGDLSKVLAVMGVEDTLQ